MEKVVVIILLFFIFTINVSAQRDSLSDIECIDGDTIRARVNGKMETIRFLAINTPETKYSTKDKDEPYAIEASKYTCNRLTDSNNIEIEYDIKSNKTDKYGRFLGWIFVDNFLLQKELIKKGYAKVDYVYDEYKYVNELKKEESIAKKKKLGIWSSDEENNDDEDESAVNKILNYIWDILKKLFTKIYENIKNYVKNVLKDKIDNIIN